jgi:hypothetical protein
MPQSGPDDDLDPSVNSPVETDAVHQEEECGDPEGEPDEEMEEDDADE